MIEMPPKRLSPEVFRQLPGKVERVTIAEKPTGCVAASEHCRAPADDALLPWVRCSTNGVFPTYAFHARPFAQACHHARRRVGVGQRIAKLINQRGG